MTCQDKSLLAPGLASTPVIPRYRQIIRKRAVLMLAIALAMMASLMVDVTCGSSGLPLSALWQALFQPEKVNAGIHVIVWDIRLPYALMALLVGMALGLAGAEMQTILNNPLATPFTLGVSSAAALALRWRLCWGSVFPVFLPPGLSRPMRSSLRCYPRYSWTVLPVGQASPHPEWCCSVLRWYSPLTRWSPLCSLWLMKIRCRGWYSGRWGAWCASWEKLGVLAVVFIAVLFARYEAPGNSRHYVWAKRGR